VAALTPAFFDTSVLVAGLMEMGEASEYPQKILTGIAGGQIRRSLTAWHCCLEFYSVATRLPEEFRLAPEDALVLLHEEIFPRFEVRQLPDDGWEPFLRMVEHDRIVGGRIYDAHIAEIARRADSQAVVTDNRRHFSSLARHGIRVLSADEFARAAQLTR
jgi:predicted nucleic acid-binding protein